MTFHLRDFEPTADKPAALAFILGSQLCEAGFEADRRTDPAVAGDYYAVLTARLARQQGLIYVADNAGRAFGWAAFAFEEAAVYVVETERRFGYIAELFVIEAERGAGVGRALIGACEAEARRLGLRQVRIGLLAANHRAADIYARSGYAPYAAELRKYL